MGGVQQAVLEFDQEVQAPWRPRLTAVPDPVEVGSPAVAPAASPTSSSRARPRTAAVDRSPARPSRPRPYPSRRALPRIGVCAPPAGVPAAPGAVARPAGARTPQGSGPRRMPPLRSGSATGRRAGVRLTRRARVLAVVLALAAALALGSWLGAVLTGDGGLRLAGDRSVVVRSGDTLWSIATALGDDRDVRAVIDEIQRLNDLEGAPLQPGQELRLP